jgi:hypothetical protein
MVNGHVVLMCVLSAYTITKHLYNQLIELVGIPHPQGF